MSSAAKSRNFRRRADDNDNNESNNNNVNSSSSSSKPKKKLLSFADDDDDNDEGQDSRRSRRSKSASLSSSLSSRHKLSASKDRLPSTTPTTTTSSNVLPQAGTYTKEALLELQKNTRTLARPATSTYNFNSDSSSTSSTSDPKIILKGLLKPPEETLILPKHQPQSQVSPVVEQDDYSFIPDEDTIKKIRAKRERLRQSRAAASDYISLEAGSNHVASEDDDVDEEPEFRSRIAMISNKLEAVFQNDDDKAQAPLVVALAKEDPADDYDDDEDKIWEEEQFRKALGKRMDDASAANNRAFTTNTFTSATTAMIQQQQQHQQQSSTMMYIGGALGDLDALSIPQQAEVAHKALQDNFRRLQESHSRTISLLTKTDENLSSSLMNITALEKSLSAAGEKFIFMQKLRDFVSVICEFLQHKAPFIEELEEQMQKLHEQRALAILDRRSADNNDEMTEVEVAVKAATSIFNERGSSAAAIAAASSAAQAALVAMKDQTNLPVKLDEYGRDINQQKRMDLKRRAEARQRRKARFDAKRLSYMEIDSSVQKIEGESSTDESDSESAAYQSNRDLLLQTADQIFSDASDEYSQLSVVKGRFERWKKEYSTSYRDAYMSLSTPAIFSPYVRLELLKWDPLHEDADFIDMKWHSLLFHYGLPENGTHLDSSDEDANLVPGLVEKVAIPVLHHAIAHCWDMLSTRETINAVFATSLVTNYVSTSSKALAELLVAIRTRLAEAVANITVPTWSPLVLKAVPSAARVAAYRFGMSVRLMKNICLWRDILALPVLEKLVLDELMCEKVLPHVRSISSDVHDAVTRTERIVSSLSGVWAGQSVTVECSRKLQPLVDLVLSLARTLEKKLVAGMNETDTSGLARRLKKMLIELNDYDNARDLVRTFRLKEAL